MPDHKNYIEAIAQRAREAFFKVAHKSSTDKNNALRVILESIRDNQDNILKANKKDIEYASDIGKSQAIIDRLTITEKRIQGMIKAIEEIIALPDPVGSGNTIVKRPNGLRLHKVRVPIGVVAIIYESRPNVTVDASALTLKSGNSVILRGGKEAIHSNTAIARAIRDALKYVGFPVDAVQMIDRTEHEIVNEMLKLDKLIDLVIPRGGEGLIRMVTENSRIPVIKHDKGVCHVFIDQNAPFERARDISVNAKVSRPSVCNAIETLLFHKDFPYIREVLEALKAEKVEIRGTDEIRQIFPDALPVSEEDWTTEYLDLILSVKTVADVNEAIVHINTYGSHHSDAIISNNYEHIERFLEQVDSAAVFANASTRFTDGGEFGLGAEIGISTQKLHVRGPMGLEGLTSEKWVIYGDGQIR